MNEQRKGAAGARDRQPRPDGLNRREMGRLLVGGAVAAGLAGAAGPAGLAGVARAAEHNGEAMPYRVIAEGLRFPEGPIAMDDGSVVLTEIEKGTIARISADGAYSVVADVGGGPNGAAIGPDGACYVTNNGGFEWTEEEGILFPGNQPEDYTGGKIQRVDLETGDVRDLYTEVNGIKLRGPNDLVFDGKGGFWFTDLGKGRPRTEDRGGLYYAKADGSMVKEVVYPLVNSNGCGLSPDGREIYVAETLTSRIWAFEIIGEGEIKPAEGIFPGRLVVGLGGLNLLDSMAVEANGNICVATLVNSGITTVSPDGESVTFTPVPGDILVTNICFGGPDMKTAFITLSTTGKLVAMDWPRPGLKLAHTV